MKKSHAVPILLAVIWIMVTAAAGCGWRKVDNEKKINFNWDSHILEVTTEEISSDNIEDKRLEIMLDMEKQTGEIALKIWNFHLSRSVYNGVEVETLYFEITFREENTLYWTQKPPGELRWIFKKEKILKMIVVELAGTILEETLVLTNEDRTEMFRFSSGDNISLLYRLNSTVGDDDCVKPR